MLNNISIISYLHKSDLQRYLHSSLSGSNLVTDVVAMHVVRNNRKYNTIQLCASCLSSIPLTWSQHLVDSLAYSLIQRTWIGSTEYYKLGLIFTCRGLPWYLPKLSVGCNEDACACFSLITLQNGFEKLLTYIVPLSSSSPSSWKWLPASNMDIVQVFCRAFDTHCHITSFLVLICHH